MRRGRLLSVAAVVLVCACGPAADPEEVLTRRTVGLAYLEENRLEEAEAEFQRLIALVPDEPLGHANLAVTLLRQARYDEAEAAVREAIRLSPDNPDLQLILATIQGHAGDPDGQGAVLEALVEAHPDHVPGLYTLAEWLRDEQPEESTERRIELLTAVTDAAPANLPARLQLIDLLLASGDAVAARTNAELVQSQLPELPAEAAEPFARALSAMRNGNAEAAQTPMRLTHNALRVTQLYSAGILDVVGPGGPSVGFPVLTFSRDFSTRVEDADAVFSAMQFSDGTALAGLTDVTGGSATHTVAVGDYDQDGDHDLAIGTDAGVVLMQNEFGAFESAPAPVTGPVRHVRFADIDNDGWLDLVTAGPNGVLVSPGASTSPFSGSPTPLDGAADGTTVIDLDQDGDLDLISWGNNGPAVWRNNLDGTFTQRTDLAGFGGSGAGHFALGDFDDDGDVDLLGLDGSTLVRFDNRREGRFQPESVAGLDAPGTSIAVGDYTNDGWLDALVSTRTGGWLFINQRDGTLERDEDPAVASALASGTWTASTFADVDNDGRQDLVVTGDPASGPGVVVLRNTGAEFERRTDLVAAAGPGEAIAALDYNEDGDLDFVVAGNSGVTLLRNDGGDGNRYLNIALVGLRAGNGKNNHFGIGAKVEVRAGDLYQVRIVDGPVTHFGLGQRLKADAVRIQWTNGVPQNLFYPGSDQDVVEEQTLKGSCAFLYTYNGREYTFVTDVVWRSALGMPMGIMGGSSTYAPAYPSQEYVRIPSGALAPVDGEFRISVTEELWEAAYLDELRLIVVDSPDSVDVYVDERFRPPGPGTVFAPYLAGTRWPVKRAVDDRGNDVTSRLAEHDFSYVDNLVPGPYQGVTRMHDLVLELGEAARGRNDIVLYLAGWLFPSDASINVAVAQSEAVASFAPVLQVRHETGAWVTVVPDLSFPSGKNKTVVVDLNGLFLSADRSVRVRTNMEVYWDHAFFTLGTAQVQTRVHELPVTAAALRYRGFSRMYRKGGPYGPHWFDYADVSPENPWGVNMTGRYTRFGDVAELLTSADDRSAVMAPGDEILVAFADETPPLPPGWSRSYFLYSDGWIKDADMNTATGNEVGPLPYRAAARYPFAAEEFFADARRAEYDSLFNTRHVTR